MATRTDMGDTEFREAVAALPGALAALGAAGDGWAGLPALAVALGERGIGEEAARLAAWYLLDRGELEIGPRWRLRARVGAAGD